MTDRPLVVVKVGGSLLGWDALPARLADLLASLRAQRLLLIAGGGAAADFIRELDRTHGLGDTKAHALAVRALDLTAHALAALVPGLCVVEALADLNGPLLEGLVPVLATRRFLDEEDRTATDPLPHSWQVTSDAIAARVAARLGAAELVLLKSAPLPPSASRAEAARLGLVDPAFVEAAAAVGRVSYINLRATPAVGVAL